MTNDIPARPRLADHVAARRHLVAGQVVVALHDERADRVATVGDREWGLLLAADGTRDLEGIVAAARRAGHGVSLDNARAFLDQLAAAGMLAEGPSSPPTSITDRMPPLPVRGMAGFSLRCHGRGTCCRLYPTTSFSPAEARAALHHDEDAFEHERFTPERGSERLPWGGRSVTMVDGRCHYLADDGRCRLHAVAGPEAKPLGCRLFPVQLVRDGRQVRVAVAPECACVLDSALDANEGPPLLEPWPSDSHALDDAAFVFELPERIAMAADRTVAREAFVAWCDEAAETFAGFDGDAARWLWAEADRIGGAESPPARRDTVGAGFPSARPDLDAVERRRVHLVSELERREQLATWRSPTDLAAQLPRWLGQALDRDAARLVAEISDAPTEHAFVRALLFGHDPARSAPTVVDALRRRAMQVWIARHLADVLAADERGRADPAAHQPLALVAGYARAFGL